MRIGLIFCAWEAYDQIGRSLGPWIAQREGPVNVGHETVICAVSVPFKGFEQPARLDGTLDFMRQALAEDSIDHLITSDEPLTEVEARGRALRWLVDQGCDILWQADADEFPTADEILRTVRFIEARPGIAWFRGSLKNLVFTLDQHLVEPFTPPRIHRVRVDGYRAHSFWDDNNVLYGGTITRDLKKDTTFPSMTIPKAVSWTVHDTWRDNLRSRDKCRYQESRGWSCSFRWDETTEHLCWNEAHFARTGQPIPEVERD